MDGRATWTAATTSAARGSNGYGKTKDSPLAVYDNPTGMALWAMFSWEDKGIARLQVPSVRGEGIRRRRELHRCDCHRHVRPDLVKLKLTGISTGAPSTYAGEVFMVLWILFGLSLPFLVMLAVL